MCIRCETREKAREASPFPAFLSLIHILSICFDSAQVLYIYWLSILRVPGAAYTRNASRTLNLISTFLCKWTGHDSKVVRSTSTCTISVYHLCCEFDVTRCHCTWESRWTSFNLLLNKRVFVNSAYIASRYISVEWVCNEIVKSVYDGRRILEFTGIFK